MSVRGGDLAATFRRLIRADGPMTVAHFMGESNAHYYASRDPLGAAGDFVTAPEISQMFGELIGLWLVNLWDRAGRVPGPFYAELGPGRGTLARDALRAMAQAGLKPPVHFVEGSPPLRAIQAKAVLGARFHEDVTTLPETGPLLLIANEFFDAFPIRQLVRTETGWRERMVALDGEEFVFVAGPLSMDESVSPSLADAPAGTIIETSAPAAAAVGEIARRLVNQGGAALLIDYGHLAQRTGSTLQAVRAHRSVDPLAMPGEADLTAHVDFAVLAEIAARAGCTVHASTQGEWLEAMGIGLRADALSRAAPDAAEPVAVARDRLVDAAQMGQLFKVMAVIAPDWPQPPGFGF